MGTLKQNFIVTQRIMIISYDEGPNFIATKVFKISQCIFTLLQMSKENHKGTNHSCKSFLKIIKDLHIGIDVKIKSHKFEHIVVKSKEDHNSKFLKICINILRLIMSSPKSIIIPKRHHNSCSYISNSNE
jgi:hypothetical protein